MRGYESKSGDAYRLRIFRQGGKIRIPAAGKYSKQLKAKGYKYIPYSGWEKKI
jgi:hypothetical protein